MCGSIIIGVITYDVPSFTNKNVGKKAMNPKSKITNERGFMANINEITQRHFN